MKWIDSAESDKKDNLSDCSKNIGWIKHGFMWAMHLLYCGNQYKDALSNLFCSYRLEIILEQGGDTDTNACIVGGIIGAAVGYNMIPLNMKEAVLKYRDPVEGKGVKRPEWLITGLHLPNLISQIFNNAASSVTIES